MSGNHAAKNRVQEHFTDEVSGAAERCVEAVDEVIQENPTTVILATFGAGLALGCAVAVMLSRPHRETPRSMAESFGRKILDSLADVLPDSVKQHLPH
jgi:hypothetical protein